MKKMKSYRIEELTNTQLEELANISGRSQAEIIGIAINDYYQDIIKKGDNNKDESYKKALEYYEYKKLQKKVFS